MEIKLPKPTDVVVQEEKKETVSSVKLRQFTDNGTSVEALIAFGEANGPDQKTKTITVWDGEEYAKAGQYTDEDIAKRIAEILS